MRTPPVPVTLRRVLLAALAALTLGLAAVALLTGFSSSTLIRMLEGLAVFGSGALVLGGAIVLVMIHLAGWRTPEPEFDALVERSERLAEDPWDGEDGEEEDEDEWDEDLVSFHDEEDFKALVRAALDELPLEFHRALEHVAVVVVDGGRRRRAYGLYEGGTVARDHFHDRILIFRDTLLRDFGHDPDLLRAQITRVVRHEIAHHLGWDEPGVRGLGL